MLQITRVPEFGRKRRCDEAIERSISRLARLYRPAGALDLVVDVPHCLGIPGVLRESFRLCVRFYEQRSIIDYLRTEPRRLRIEAPTNCGRFAPSF